MEGLSTFDLGESRAVWFGGHGICIIFFRKMYHEIAIAPTFCLKNHHDLQLIAVSLWAMVDPPAMVYHSRQGYRRLPTSKVMPIHQPHRP